MNELLSPAGTLEAFYAAISNGANAIYLGLDKYSARAYANNFTIDNLKKLLVFAHLRNVKIYVTINTIVYDNELEECYKTIDELANIGVDGIIVQDLAILNYITSHYKSLHAHASTQMGIDDIEGATLAKELGCQRIVFARETDVETLKEIKDKLGIEIEAFIHGALCVGYSGNCLMSSMIGERSGNRGRCAGCCRKPYTLINVDNGKEIKDGYLLSMKDLNVSSELNKMKFIDSFKIEGRMKEPNYVASVTRYYRNLLDNKPNEKDALLKVFNRTYTKGFINNESSTNVTNIEKPNNYGYEIGTIDRYGSGKIWIKLFKPLNKGDQIRIETDSIYDEISVPVLKLYDSSFNVVKTMSKMAILDCDKKVKVGAKVYKTKDINFVEAANKTLLNKEYTKLPIDIEFHAEIGKPIILVIQYQKSKAYVKSDYIVEQALSSSTTEDNIKEQLNKLNDTPYVLRNLNINIDEDIFIPLKLINELRREGIEKLNTLRTEVKVIKNDKSLVFPAKSTLNDPEIAVEVSNDEQFKLAKELGIKHIYYKNIVRRNNAIYKDINDEVLVGGLGGLNYYKNKNNIVTDYSFNVCNYETVGILSSLGANRITLSNEIDKDSIIQLVDDYYKNFKTFPNLELIIYGRAKLMHSKYCPLKRLGMCGQCKTNHFALKDDFATFPIVFNDDCTTTILNSKVLNIIDDIDNLHGVNCYRLVFTDESIDEMKEIINLVKDKLENKIASNSFNKEKHTRGHFIKRPL